MLDFMIRDLWVCFTDCVQWIPISANMSAWDYLYYKLTGEQQTKPTAAIMTLDATQKSVNKGHAGITRQAGNAGRKYLAHDYLGLSHILQLSFFWDAMPQSSLHSYVLRTILPM